MTLLLGDMLAVLDTLDENSLHACVTDPPYDLVSITKRFGKADSAPAQYGTDGLFQRKARGFMGQHWDGQGIAFKAETWGKVYRVLRPGAFLLAFGSPRTYHRMVCAIEDAGFIVKDCLMFLHAQGFPKSKSLRDIGHPEMGSALKPSYEPIVLCQKPISETSISANFTRWGTGCLNIDAARIAGSVPSVPQPIGGTGDIYGFKNGIGRNGEMSEPHANGRWPSNVVLSHSSLPVVRLTAMIQSDVSQCIRGYFNGYIRVSDLRQRRQEENTRPKVLQSRVPPRSDTGQAKGSTHRDDVPALQEDILLSSVVGKEWSPEVLQYGLQGGTPDGDARGISASIRDDDDEQGAQEHGRGRTQARRQEESTGERTPELEGRQTSLQGISVAVHCEASTGGSGACSADDILSLHPGTSTCSSESLGATAYPQGECASPEWTEGRQPTRELDGHGTRRTLSGASETGSGNGTLARGEQTLEVLAVDVPDAWIQYFELTGEDLGCEEIGTRRVKATSGSVTGNEPSKPAKNVYGEYQRKPFDRYAAADGTEQVSAFRCVEGCPILELDRQSGMSASRDGKTTSASRNVFRDGGFGKDYTKTMHNDSGGASRFFQTFPPEVPRFVETSIRDCWLCDATKRGIMSVSDKEFTPCESVNTAEKSSKSKPRIHDSDSVADDVQHARPLGSEDNSQSKNSFAPSAESNSVPTPVTIKSTARSNAWDLQSGQLVHSVRSAGNLCETCATAIAQSLAKLALNPTRPSEHHQDSTVAPFGTILSHCLALYVASLESTDTIPTTASLTRLFGYVFSAIDAYTNSANLDEPGESDLPRFRFQSKPSRAERNRGLAGMPEHMSARYGEKGQGPLPQQTPHVHKSEANHHPTVKSVTLMKHLLTLVVPPNGTVIDPFAGSGSTLVAAIELGMNWIGVEQDEGYHAIAAARILDAELRMDAEQAIPLLKYAGIEL